MTSPVDVIDLTLRNIQAKVLHKKDRLEYYGEIPTKEELLVFLSDLLKEIEPLLYTKQHTEPEQLTLFETKG